MMRDFRPTCVRPAVTALGAADLRDVLTTIAVPTLLIYGDADVRSPADVVGRDMRTGIPGSTLVVIPDAPHMVNLQQPEAFEHGDPSPRLRGLTDHCASRGLSVRFCRNLHPPFQHVAYPACPASSWA